MSGQPLTRSVVVIHGVSNRDEAAFDAEVAHLQAALADQGASDLRLIPAFWGDLGAHDSLLGATLPERTQVRDDDQPLDFGLLSLEQGEGQPLRDDLEWRTTLILEGLRETTAANAQIRDQEEDDAKAVRDALAQATWLRLTNDPNILRAAGRLLAPVPVNGGSGGQNGTETFALRDSEELRFRLPDVPGYLRRRVDDIDALIGTVVARTVGRFNQSVRGDIGPGVARFFGDVLVYQRHAKEIQRRVLERARANDPDLGCPGSPALVIGHSLGGVIAFDLACATEPAFHTKALVTFGSQSAFFHVVDPRNPPLVNFGQGNPTVLPPSLARWTNLWEPLDVAAFVAGRVFRLHDGSAPFDIEVPHQLSYGLWTHSIYWELPILVSQIVEMFATAG